MSAPFHVLLLSGGDTLPQPRSDNLPIEHHSKGDYLVDRHGFQSRVLPQSGLSTESGGVSCEISTLQSLSSQLEVAMAACCERYSHECSQLPLHLNSCSGVHRPLFPANYLPRQLHYQCNVKSTMTDRGILRSGKECHFLKLISLYCPKDAVGHRSLAVGILQRTVEWEVPDLRPQSKFKPVNKSGECGRKGDMGYTCKVPGSGSPCTQLKRTKSFLAAGGMKLIARWLVDSFTVVPGTFTHQFKPGQPVLHKASATGFLLLPILQILVLIPFDKHLVVTSQIHKSIKRLKKALSTLTEGLESNTLNQEVHPIAGGMSVGRVIAAVDTLMASWSKAASLDKTQIDEPHSKSYSHHQLKSKVQFRFDDMVRFQNEERDPPIWLPEGIVGFWSAVPNPLSAHHIAQVKECKRKVDFGDGDEGCPSIKKLKGSANKEQKRSFFLHDMHKLSKTKANMPNNGLKKQVSWADRELSGSSPPGSDKGGGRLVISCLPELIGRYAVPNTDKCTLYESDIEDLF